MLRCASSARTLAASLAPAAALPTVLETVTRTLRVPYAAILIEQEGELELAAEQGAAPGERQTVPLAYAGVRVGALEIGLRPGDELSASDRLLLGGLARQAGVAVHAVRLTADLQRSRERLVTAREEERRRLRRDLHDGLGPTLAAMLLQLHAAGHLIATDSTAADAALNEVKGAARAAVGDIRRLVYELRPPALDELGLVGALERQAEAFSSLDVRVDAPAPVGGLPAAVEVAAYRIAVEAMTNVARHSQASHCRVCVELNGGTRARGQRRRPGHPRALPRKCRPGLHARARSGARRHLYDRARAEWRNARPRPPAHARGVSPLERIRVLIADDHPVFRGGLRTLLSALGEAEVVGEASTGAEAVKAAEELQPDVVVMDLHMPELNGIEATRQICQQSPHIGVLVLTMFEDDDSVFAAMRAGAKGYLLKGADQDDIVRAIAAVGSGEAIFGPDIAKRVIEYFTVPRASHAAQAFPELTEREREVLEMVAQGHNNAWMARHFVLSQKTIRNHVSNIFTKLQVADRAQAIVRAREAGMGQQSTKL